ncbi:hypothetical protein, partial [Micromonospora humida]|uniref:hypothetical protein n=1 Tax=Micromonospora humida TaxID=2809018 RepID=UPI00342A5791
MAGPRRPRSTGPVGGPGAPDGRRNRCRATADRRPTDPFIGQAVGSGHFVQLQVPAQVDAMVDRYLEVT